MTTAVRPPGWSLSGAAVLEPWKARVLESRPFESWRRPGPTASELHLWEALGPLGWCREYATGPYRLDFYLPSHRLAVEVDGSSHDGPVRRAADDRRDLWHLERLGIQTLRFTAERVMRDCDGVLADIGERLAVLSAAERLEEGVLSVSGELPVVEAAAEAEALDMACERVEAEIQSYVGVACATILPVFEQRKPWARALSRVR